MSGGTTRHWLNGPRIRRWTLCCLATQLVFALVLVAGTHGWLMRLDRPATTDFVSFYAAGRLAAGLHPADAYNRVLHFAAEQRATAPGIAYVYFFYPPVFLLLCRVLAVLPYLAAFAAMQLGGLAVWLPALWRILPRGPGWRLLPALSFSPVLWNIGFGQNALLTAGLFGAGTLLLQARRGLAGGIVLGLLIYKPHAGLLLPVALLAARNWRALGGACIGAGGAIALSVVVLGPGSWAAFATALAGSARGFDTGVVTPFCTTITVLGALRDHGVGSRTALCAEIATQLVAAGLVGWCWACGRPGASRQAVLVSGAVLTMPVALFYELCTLSIAGAWLARDARAGGWRAGERTGLGAIWLCGLLCYPLSRALHLPLGLLCVVLMFALSVRRCAPWRRSRTIHHVGAVCGRRHGSVILRAGFAGRMPGHAPLTRSLIMLDYARNWIALKTDQRGVTALEYAIIAGVLGIGLVAIFGTFKTSLSTLFVSVATAM